MNREDIIRLSLMGERTMKQRIEWAVNMEREACAKVCDEYDVAEDVCSSDTAEGIAAAVRARGQV